MKKTIRIGVLVVILVIIFGLFANGGIVPNIKNAILTILGRGPMSSEEVSEAFQEAINQKDYQGLQKLLADRVYFGIEGGDCCDNVSRNGAITQLERYLKTADTLNFSQDQQPIEQLKASFPDKFGGCTIGISDAKKMLAFRVGSQGKVDEIYVAQTYEMLNLK